MTIRSSYKELVDKLKRPPQGAPISESLFQILRILFSKKEAKLISMLPIKPFTAKVASKIWGKNIKETKSILNDLASRAMVLDIASNENDEAVFFLPPPMAGFFEFSMMRLKPGDKTQKVLGELYYQYLNVEEDFIKDLFAGSETALTRVLVNESVLSSDNAIHVLDYERTSHVIKTASHIGVGACYCRHKMLHMGKNCSAPINDFCLTLNVTARSLIKHGYIRQIDVKEAMGIIEKTYELNLVQCGENVQNNVDFICNCCGCCCEALTAARKVGLDRAIFTTQYIPTIDSERCTGCGECARGCPIEALSIETQNYTTSTKVKKAKVNEKLCLGCGVCVKLCPKGTISLKCRDKKIITPIDSVHRTVQMAIEKGKLHDLIFDIRAHWNHRMMAAILGAILKLPPIKQLLATQQVKSKYLAKLLTTCYK